MRLVTMEEMRQLESAAERRGLTVSEMMRRAGEAVSRLVEAYVGYNKNLLVLVGPGNNGGDALAAAIELHEMGHYVSVYVWRRDMDGDELVGEVLKRRISLQRFSDDPRLETLEDLIIPADGIIDGLLGSGSNRPIGKDLASILNMVREEVAGLKEKPRLLAVDVPTGVNLDDGSIDPNALAVDATVTFGYPKLGQFRFPGASYFGEIVHDTLGIPDAEGEPTLFTSIAEEVRARLPARPLDAHKGTFGSALIVAGSANFTGAAYLAAEGAYRSGCGLVTVALPGSLHSVIAGLVPEATFLHLPEDLGVVAKGGAALVREAWSRYEALLVGPGLTSEKAASEFLEALLAAEVESEQHPAPEVIGFRRGVLPPKKKPRRTKAPEPVRLPPWVVDADALNLIAKIDGGPQRLPAGSVLTPHPGEMSRLLGLTVDEVNADRVEVARRAAAKWGHVVVLKGAFTVMATPDGKACVNPHATPALATAGTGDVLAGLIVGFMAQGLAAFDAAIVATYLHAQAGKEAAEELGDRSVMAGDVLEALPRAYEIIEESPPSLNY